MAKPLRLGILVSGSGTTFQFILDRISAGELDAGVEMVLSSSRKAYAIERAKAAGIPVRVVARGEFASRDEFDAATLNALASFDIDLLICAGYMSFIGAGVIDRFRNRIINTHPALIPAFCGQDMYGDHVHEAALAKGVKISGCTIHLVDEIYDHGAILMQQAVPVLDDDTVETLRARVQAAEKPLFCDAIQAFAEGRVEVRGDRASIRKA